MNKTDVGAYIWPAYCDNPLTKRFWEGNLGEWISVKTAVPKFSGHKQPRVPLWGYLDESHPDVMEMQIDEAVSHGVNVFIYDWYWYNNAPFLENCLNEGFLKARNNDKIKFYIMWANHDVNGVWHRPTASSSKLHDIIWSASVTEDEFKKICKRIIENYFSHPSYYKIDGCPVFSINDIGNVLRDFKGSEGALRMLSWFREETIKAGFPNLHLQGTLRNELLINADGLPGTGKDMQSSVVKQLKFDSLTHYQLIHFRVFKDKEPYKNISDDFFNYIENIEREFNTTYFPHVSIGWDNNPRYDEKVYRSIIADSNPAEFERALLKAERYLNNRKNQHRLITINSWNEWTEGSYLMPDNFFGYGYLDAVKRVFG